MPLFEMKSDAPRPYQGFLLRARVCGRSASLDSIMELGGEDTTHAAELRTVFLVIWPWCGAEP